MPSVKSMLVAVILSFVALADASRARGSAPASAPAARIVSTVPAATLNLVLIGAADRLAGVSKYDLLYLPENKRDLPVVGDYETMNYEQLVKLHPSVLVIQTAESRIPARLREFTSSQHIELVNLRFDKVDDIWTSVRTLGKAAGMEKEAQAAIDKAQADLKDLAAQYKDAPHPKVVYLVSPKLMLLCGGKTFIDEMITAAGGQNTGAVAGDGFLDIGRETLVKLAPDVLLIGALEEPVSEENDPRLAPWLQLPLPAAKKRRVYLVTDGNSLMASVNIAKNVRALADLIHRGDPPASQPAVNRGAAGRVGGNP
jgi:iron complex transport system substrate-binding protein